MKKEIEAERIKPILINPNESQLLLAEIFDDLEVEEDEVIVSGK